MAIRRWTNAALQNQEEEIRMDIDKNIMSDSINFKSLLKQSIISITPAIGIAVRTEQQAVKQRALQQQYPKPLG